MSMWDNLLPHRFLINRSLRKASDELRDRIDSYRIEHEMAVQRCHDEIEADKKEKDRQFELRKQEYLKDLTQVSGALGELQTLFLDYVDLYMKMKHLYFIKDKMKLELQLLNEYSNFLTEQMKLIGEEIGILEQRQESLSLQVKIDDIVALISLTGADLPCDASDNPKTLLEKVNLLFIRNNIPPQTKSALLRLRKLLYERAEYLPLIQYISWLIQQKKNLSRNLSKERRGVNESKKLLKNKLTDVDKEINQYKEQTLHKAISIRNVWAKPLAETYIELAAVTKSLDEKYNRQKEISAEIKTMKSEHSNDSDRWDQLQSEGSAVYEAIGRLKGRKTKLSEQRRQWVDRKKAIFNLLNKNDICLMAPKDERVSDEIRVLKQSRDACYEKIKEAEQCLQETIAQILHERYQQETILSNQILMAEKSASEKRQCLTDAENKVKKMKKQDNRTFFARILSESKEVINAKECRDIARNKFMQANQLLAGFQAKLITVNADCEKQLSKINQQHKHQIRGYQKDISDIDLAISFIEKKKRR